MAVDWSSPTMKHLRWWPAAILSATFMVYWVRIVLKAQGDFPNHWELGRRMLSGQFIYAGGLDFVYPPFLALAHVPLAMIDVHLAQVLAYPLGPLALAGLLWTLHHLARRPLPSDSDRLFWSTTVALVLAFHFFTRDLLEVGINTALITLSWFAIFLWTENRVGAADISLGLTAASKCAPLLVTAYLGLKRECAMATASTSACVLFSLSSLMVQGPAPHASGAEMRTT